ncbi:hypothetical protein R6Q59_027790 [Mikania micrantha]
MDLCAALFDGNAATGNRKWSSTQTTSIVGSSSIHRVQQFLLMDTEDDAGTSQHNTPEQTTDPYFNLLPNPNKRPRTSKSTSISADDLANDMKKALQYLIKGNEGPTVLECSDKLKLRWYVEDMKTNLYDLGPAKEDKEQPWLLVRSAEPSVSGKGGKRT